MKYIRGGDAPFSQGTSVVRIAPERGGKLATSVWRFWIEKNEIYAVSRMGGHQSKLSVHSTGQIHLHRGPRNTIAFPPPMPLSDALWHHAVEIRFLLHGGADSPPDQLSQLKKKKDKLIVVAVPDGHMLVLNLLVTAIAASSPMALPPEYSGVPEIWRTRLMDKRDVVLIARTMPFDQQSTATLDQVLNVKTTFNGPLPSELPYVEAMYTSGSDKGNVLQVVPLGDKARRFDKIGAKPDESVDSRSVKVECPRASANLVAPDGSIVGVVSIEGLSAEVRLVKDKEVVYTIGHAALLIHPDALRWGATFQRPRFPMECTLIVGGVSPRSWQYEYELSFDGETATVLISQLSADLRNVNQYRDISEIGPREEILIRAPSATLRLDATKDRVGATAELTCAFRLRDFDLSGEAPLLSPAPSAP